MCSQTYDLKVTEHACPLVRINAKRAISGARPIEEQQRSVRPDMLVMKDGLDFAVSECSKDDVGGIGKKEIVERQLHLPKY